MLWEEREPPTDGRTGSEIHVFLLQTLQINGLTSSKYTYFETYLLQCEKYTVSSRWHFRHLKSGLSDVGRKNKWTQQDRVCKAATGSWRGGNHLTRSRKSTKSAERFACNAELFLKRKQPGNKAGESQLVHRDGKRRWEDDEEHHDAALCVGRHATGNKRAKAAVPRGTSSKSCIVYFHSNCRINEKNEFLLVQVDNWWWWWWWWLHQNSESLLNSSYI